MHEREAIGGAHAFEECGGRLEMQVKKAVAGRVLRVERAIRYALILITALIVGARLWCEVEHRRHAKLL